MIWARFIGLSALAMLVACSNDGKDVAAGSFETENSIAFHVRHADGSLAAKAKVIINTADYLASGNSTISRRTLSIYSSVKSSGGKSGSGK